MREMGYVLPGEEKDPDEILAEVMKPNLYSQAIMSMIHRLQGHIEPSFDIPKITFPFTIKPIDDSSDSEPHPRRRGKNYR
jgi:hypothetical protein